MKKIISLLAIFTTMSLNALTTSVIVPCYHAHFKFLPELCQSLSEQSILPDEVVISVSEVDKIDYDDFVSFSNISYPFPVVIATTNEKLFAGQNRNVACAHAQGDIFICQDADDIPHPQRIEIVKHFFETHSMDMLLHRWVGTDKWHQVNSIDYASTNIPFFSIKRWEDNEVFDRIHYGNSCLRREVFDEVKWTDLKNGEDKRLLEDSMKKGFTLGMIDAFLLIYRVQYSSGN